MDLFRWVVLWVYSILGCKSFGKWQIREERERWKNWREINNPPPPPPPPKKNGKEKKSENTKGNPLSNYSHAVNSAEVSAWAPFFLSLTSLNLRCSHWFLRVIWCHCSRKMAGLPSHSFYLPPLVCPPMQTACPPYSRAEHWTAATHSTSGIHWSV